MILSAQGCLETPLAVVFAIDGIALAMKELLEQRAELGVIVNDENPHGSNVARTATGIRKGL